MKHNKQLTVNPFDSLRFMQDVPPIVSLDAVHESVLKVEREAIKVIVSVIRWCDYAKDDIEVRTQSTRNGVYRYGREYWSKSENRMLAGYWLDAMVGDTAIRLTRDLSPLKERYEQVVGATDGE